MTRIDSSFNKQNALIYTKETADGAWKSTPFKDCKTYLGFGKCQSTCFASQIAAATLCCLQYNVLSVARRFSDYETIGGLFREVTRDTIQLSVAQQIWGMLQELVTAIAEAFELLDEEIYDAVINRSENLAHIANFYNFKDAC